LEGNQPHNLPFDFPADGFLIAHYIQHSWILDKSPVTGKMAWLTDFLWKKKARIGIWNLPDASWVDGVSLASQISVITRVTPSGRSSVLAFHRGEATTLAVNPSPPHSFSLRVVSFLGLFVYARLMSQSRGSIPYRAWC